MILKGEAYLRFALPYSLETHSYKVLQESSLSSIITDYYQKSSTKLEEGKGVTLGSSENTQFLKQIKLENLFKKKDILSLVNELEPSVEQIKKIHETIQKHVKR